MMVFQPPDRPNPRTPRGSFLFSLSIADAFAHQGEGTKLVMTSLGQHHLRIGAVAVHSTQPWSTGRWILVVAGGYDPGEHGGTTLCSCVFAILI